MPKMYLGKREFNKYLPVLNNSNLFVNISNYELDYETLSFLLAEVKTALMLNSWINELSEDEICEGLILVLEIYVPTLKLRHGCFMLQVKLQKYLKNS